jgi:hypothetical protein
VTTRIGCECASTHENCHLSPADSRLESARRRLEGMGGRIESTSTGLEIHLSCASPGSPDDD